jgi:hypothetical protein
MRDLARHYDMNTCLIRRLDEFSSIDCYGSELRWLHTNSYDRARGGPGQINPSSGARQGCPSVNVSRTKNESISNGANQPLAMPRGLSAIVPVICHSLQC